MLFKRHAYWADLYDRLKGPDWPQTAPAEVDFYLLPKEIQQEMQDFGYRLNKDFPQKWKPNGHIGLSVFYHPSHDGGGLTYGQEYVDIIKKRYSHRKFDRAFEWCSGPGFIGFSLLDHELCQHITLSDIYYPALEYAKETANYPSNFCSQMVSTYLLEDLSLLPDHEQFDLVVSNPPHADGFDTEDQWFSNTNRLTSDINWEAHKNFFENIKDHLSPDGIILLQENHAGSTIETFRPWIENAGLKITDSFKSERWYNTDQNLDCWPKIQIYYIEIKHA